MDGVSTKNPSGGGIQTTSGTTMRDSEGRFLVMKSRQVHRVLQYSVHTNQHFEVQTRVRDNAGSQRSSVRSLVDARTNTQGHLL